MDGAIGVLLNEQRDDALLCAQGTQLLPAADVREVGTAAQKRYDNLGIIKGLFDLVAPACASEKPVLVPPGIVAAPGEIGGQPARQMLAVLVCVRNEQAAHWGLGGLSRHRMRA
jgi:hypothetical protein